MDNNGTFNIPTLTDGRVIAGSTGVYIGTTTEGEIPNLRGKISVATQIVDYEGVFYNPQIYWAQPTNYSPGSTGVGFDASRVSSLYVNDATQVRAASLYMHLCIKYI